MPCSNPAPFTLDTSLPVLHLLTLPHQLYVHRYPRNTPVPAALFDNDGGWVTVSKTPEEVSIVAEKGACEGAGMSAPAAEHCGGPWTAVRVRGPLEHRESAW